MRRSVARGIPKEVLSREKDDPELQALKEADGILFPEPLTGVTPGWSWTPPVPEGPVVWADGLPPAAGELRPELPSFSAEDAAWLRSLVLPDMPVRFDARVVKYLKFYRDSKRGKAIAKSWRKKSGRYERTLRERLARAGLPTGLVWLSMVESAHNPTIRSPAGAVGLWQFIASTGRSYGLTVDRWVDERMDPVRATDAAIRYLSDLRQRFGNWELAMAAYNMGQGGLGRSIRQFNTNDFWELSRYEAGIPWETSLYVPKVMALALVMANSKAFGIDDVERLDPVQFDVVRVSAGTPLKRVAKASGSATEKLAELNPHVLAARIPPPVTGEAARAWEIRVPSGKGPSTAQRLSQLGSGVSTSLAPYVVRFGDTATAIAEDHAISGARLRRLNQMRRSERLTAGTVLLVPKKSAGDVEKEARALRAVVVPPRPFHYPDRRRVFFPVQTGDVLETIAMEFGVHLDEIRAWNGLDDTASLVYGMVLQVYVPKDATLARVRHWQEADVRILVAGSKPFFDHFQSEKGRKRITVRAKEGDTLADVARRYSLSLGWIERINRQSRRKKLEAGEEVVVYVSERAPVKDEAAPALAELPPVKAPPAEALPGKGKLSSKAAEGKPDVGQDGADAPNKKKAPQPPRKSSASPKKN